MGAVTLTLTLALTLALALTLTLTLTLNLTLTLTQSSGALRIWQLDRTPSGAAPLLSPPLGTAVWGMPMRRFVFVGFDSWLDYSPGSGSYDLHRCDHERWQRGAPLLCARLCGGRLANLKPKPKPKPDPDPVTLSLTPSP